MPVGGKARSNKRSSGTSCSSTVTTIAFVALCILGVWMLSPNSIFPLKSTTRSTISTSRSSSSISHDSDNVSRDQTKSTAEKRQPAFEDNQVDLPGDAIKTDDQTMSNADPKDESYSTPGTVSEVESENNNDNIVQENEAVDDSATGEVEAHVKDKELNVEENPQDHELPLHGKESAEELEKQKNLETQTSEESSLTLNQEVEETRKEKQSLAAHDTDSGVHENQQQTRDDHHQHRSEKQVADQNKASHEVSPKDEQVESHGDLEKHDHEEEISEEDQQKRVEQHQKQEDDQIQQGQSSKAETTQGATSNEQIEHDNTGVSSTDHVHQNPTIENEGISQHKHLPNDQEMVEKDKPSSKLNNEKDSLPSGDSSTIPRESKESKKAWSTQEDQSENQKERRKVGTEDQNESMYGHKWELCNVTAGSDYIPCLDNEKAIAKLHSRSHYEHRERHCPEEPPTCLVTLPPGYKKPIEWPHSRDKIWYSNVPHTKLAEVKGHQNWVKVTGEFLTFPGGGTQFIHGALHYIDFVQEAVPDIAWGKHTRVVLDVGCGVASFGGYLFERDVLAISFAPKDEHEAQVQFALERGIPAISAVMGTKRLPFPSKVFDIVHCARCRVPWHIEGGALLLELNRVLRPGGYFVWSATPVYQKLEEDVEIWNEMSKLTVAMCWELITIKKDKLNSVGAAVYHKPDSNECYDKRKHNQPPMCKGDDDPNASWYVPLQACMHRVPTEGNERGSEWPEEWPRRLQAPPYWLNRSQMGIYGKPAPEDFAADYEHWKRVVSKTYLSGLGISWSDVRNIMDMRAVYGGFAAALKDLKVWVMNVVNVDSPDTLPIIYERGLFGIYHDWCESFSTYPRTYDLLHADHLFSTLKKRCKVIHVLAEVDRIVRPGGKFIVRDDSSTVGEVENLLKSMHWEVHMTFSKNQQGILSAQKSSWRPDSYAASS